MSPVASRGRWIEAALLLCGAMLLPACSTATHEQRTPPPCAGVRLSDAGVCGRYQVLELRGVLTSSTGGREVPITIYAPSDAAPGSAPLILFSHGLGNSRDGYRYLGRTWASHGFVSLHLNHQGSDRSALSDKGMLGLLATFFERSHWKERLGDVELAFEWSRGDSAVVLRGGEVEQVLSLIDRSRTGLAGHSFGTLAALQFAGLDGVRSPASPRALILLSPPMLPPLVDRDGYRSIRVPTLQIAGSRDRSILRGSPGGRLPYDGISASGQYMMILSGAEHATFSDDVEQPGRRHEEQIRFLQQATTSFWNAYLAASSDGEQELLRLAEQEVVSVFERK